MIVILEVLLLREIRIRRVMRSSILGGLGSRRGGGLVRLRRRWMMGSRLRRKMRSGWCPSQIRLKVDLVKRIAFRAVSTLPVAPSHRSFQRQVSGKASRRR